MASFQPSPDLDPKVAQAIQDAMDALRAELLGHIAPKKSQAALGSGGGDRLNRLERAVEALDSAGSQTDLLVGFLEEAGAFADRALFLVRDGDELKGWAAFGFGDDDNAVALVKVRCPSEIAERGPADNPATGDVICDVLAAQRGADSIMVPFSLRGRVAGALYADRTDSTDTLDRPALRILSYVASQAVETLPLRRTEDVATAVAPVEEPEVVAEPEVAAEPDPVVEPEATLEQEPATAAAAFEPAPAEESPPSLDETDPEVEVDVERMIEEVEPEGYGEQDDTDIVAIRHEVTPTGFETVDDDEVEADRGFDTGRYETEVEEIERADAETEPDDSTIGDAATQESTAEEFASPAPVEEPVARVLEGAEVAPPPDLDGPGWAFSGSDSISDDTRHEEARRLARLLVTEIKLYNEEKVREGRESNNLYDQLRDDIERSRRIYEERIDDEVREEADYFQEEIVRILAGGDSTALGL